MKHAKVAIITRTKNRKLLLPRAIESVLGQRFTDWELVIVNDGGHPGEVEAVVERYRPRAQERIRILHHAQSKGMEAASNAGIGASASAYLVIHDDDDTWQPEFLDESVALLEKNQTPRLGGVICHSIRVLEEITGDQVVSHAREESYNSWIQEVTLFRMAARNFFPPISFLYRRSVLEEIGGYREDLPVLGDWEFNLRFLARYEIAVLRRPLACYHVRVGAQNGIYSNTITGGLDVHNFWDASLRNELLRKDLENHALGLGTLVNLARSFEEMRTRVDENSWFMYVKNKVYSLAQRAKLIP